MRGERRLVSVLFPGHVYRGMLDEAQQASDGRETGGILLGFDAPRRSNYWVTQVSGPGPDAVRERTRFRRDLEYVRAVAREAFALDGSQWIGDWHTHPCGPPEPSGRDLASWRRALERSDLETFLALILVPVSGDWSKPRVQAWGVGVDDFKTFEIRDLLDQ
jgi:integrative and conjugative element protein (TIGR02256 family)